MNIETQKRFLIRIGFWAVVILLVILCLKYVLPFLLPFVVAFLIAALLNRPIMFLAEKLNGKRVVPAILMTLLFYVAAAALFSLSLGRGDTKTGNRCGWIALILSVSAGVLLTVAFVFVELRRMRRKEGVTVDAAE